LTLDPLHILDAWIFLVGSTVGSFLNVVVSRLPRGLSIVKPASHCPKCNTPVKPYDNIPILSWLLLRAKCRSCKKPISVRYPLVELGVALLFLVMYQFFGLSWEFISFISLGSLLLAVSLIDIDTQLIPDSILITGAIIGVLLALFGDAISIENSLLGGVVMSGTLYLIALLGEKLFKKESMGFGDVKLSAMIGIFIGWKLALLAIFLSTVFGSVLGMGGIFLGRMKFGRAFAFGPFIALGAFVSGLWGEEILRLYIEWAFVR